MTQVRLLLWSAISNDSGSKERTNAGFVDGKVTNEVASVSGLDR